MNIYFSCSITGGRQDEPVYQAIVQALLSRGHSVPTAHLSEPTVMALEAQASPGEIYRRDMAWIDACDAMVAEVSTPSHGVGYEIAAALALGKPVFCCYASGKRVSKMITGNNHPQIRLFVYRDAAEAVGAVEAFLAEIQPAGQPARPLSGL